MGDLLKRLGLSAPKSATATAPGGSAGSRGGGGGGAGGGGGGGGGSPPKGPSGAPPGWPPQGPPGPQNTAAQQVHDDILNFDREVKGFRDEAEAVASKMERVTNRWRDIEAQAMRGKVGTHVYATELEKFEKEMAPLRSRQAAMAREAQVLAARAEALAVRLTDVGAAEMTIAFRTANPRDVLEIARRGIPRLPAGPGGLPGAATVEFMAFAAVTLALAYFIAQDVRYILSSDSVLQGLGRTAEVGGKYAVGAAEMALFKAVTRSTPVTAVLAMVVGMCGDQAGACEAQERREREEAQQKQMREDERQMHRAIGAFLNEQAPGSVEWLEDHWEVKNRKLWDQTVKRVQQMRVDNYVRQQMGAKIKAHELGVQDGRLSDEFIRVEDMHDWDVVKNAPVPDQRFLELFDEYKLGFKEGNAKRAALMTKYRQLGYKDGKAGRPAHRDDVASDVEVIQLLKSGVPGPMIYPQLYANYDEGFNASKAAAH